jgi:hypothetical protein
MGQELVELGPGGVACALPGERHTFANRPGEIVRFLNVNMLELAAAATTGPITSERIGEIASRYDLRVVD